MILQPHHDGSPAYTDPDGHELGALVRLRLRVPESDGPLDAVWLRSVRDAEAHYDAAVPLGTREGWTWWEATLRIVNPIQKYRWLLRGAGATRWLNAQGHWTRDVPDFQDFRLCAVNTTPAWVHSAVMYQVFPDRFARSAAADGRPTPEWAIPAQWDSTPVIGRGPGTPYQYYGGDLEGIREHLDHIQGLGATVIYLTPMFPARSNHRYDAADFSGIDPLLGGDEAFIRLIGEIHARGMRVIGDLTTNHSGDAHEWFRRALGNPSAPESEYYYFSEGNTKYIAWLGVDSLPKFNWRSRGLRNKFILDADSMAARWLQPPYNLDGWRIDVGNMTGRMGADDFNQEIAGMLLERMHAINPETMLVAESTSDAAPDFQGDTWQGAMTYTNFTRPLWQWLARSPGDDGAAGTTERPAPDRAGARAAPDSDVPRAAPEAPAAPDSGQAPVPASCDGDGNLTEQAWADFFGLPQRGPDRIDAQEFLATHLDFAAAFPWSVRLANMNAIDTHDTARGATAMMPGAQPVAVALQFALPGMPMVFMGDEFGLEGFNGENSRTPMPWNDPSRIASDLRPLYAALAGLRTGRRALAEGGIRWIHAEGGVLAFVREHPEESVLVVVSRDASEGLRLPPVLLGPGIPQPLFAHGRITLRVKETAGREAAGPAGDREAAEREAADRVAPQGGPGAQGGSGAQAGTGVVLQAAALSAGFWMLPGVAVPGALA